MRWLKGCVWGIVFSLACAIGSWFMDLHFLIGIAAIVLIVCVVLLILQTKKSRRKIQEIKSKTIIMI